MTLRPIMLAFPVALAGLLTVHASAQLEGRFNDPQETRRAMQDALQEREAAQERAEKLEMQAKRAGEAAERAAREAAALAARIQQSESGIAAAEARLALVNQQRQVLAASLAEKQKPVVQLTGALQRFSRRPLALSIMRPGSVKEMVYMRAMLSSTVPEVQQRTASLRHEIERGRALQREAEQVLGSLRSEEAQLEKRRKDLASLETRQRLASRRAGGQADREAERALALAEEARDLDSLVSRLEEAAGLRAELAALPGPMIRPARPEQSQVARSAQSSALDPERAPPGYQLPVAGRTISGFGAPTEGGALSRSVSLVPRGGAQVVAPAGGRVAYAGPYRGYGQIVILEHSGGWASLVTGMARVDVEVGDNLVGGAPLGVAAPASPLITVELRRDGEPVNPLEYLG